MITPGNRVAHDAVLSACLHPSEFERSDSNFFSLSPASDGCIYYTLSSHDIDTHARIYRYDPRADEVRLLGVLGEIVGEAGAGTIPQGKSHSPFFELDGKLYIATHYGFFMSSGNKERPAGVPEGYKQYPGGHLLEYDMATGAFRDLAKAPTAEGIITFGLDPKYRRLYCLTWPKGLFLYYELDTGEMHNLGPVSLDGEVGEGDRYMCLCRAFGVVPDTGAVYMTNPTGEILRYTPGADGVTALEQESLKRDILGSRDPHQPGHQGFNWRMVVWHPRHGVFFGVHPGSAYLFQFDPETERVELIDRICADALRRSGGLEPFRYGYLTLALGGDGDTLYYLTGVPGLVSEDGREVSEVTHLITYNLRTGKCIDHGVLRLPDGRYPLMSQTLAVHPNGKLYACPWIEKPGRTPEDSVTRQVDLISFDNPI